MPGRYRLLEVLVGMLHHPGVITVHDQFHDDEGLPWIVMELVRGRSIARTLSAEAS